MKYLRFSLLVGVSNEIDVEVVENDMRDYIEGNFDGVDFSTLPDYGMVVSEIEFQDEETRQ